MSAQLQPTCHTGHRGADEAEMETHCLGRGNGTGSSSNKWAVRDNDAERDSYGLQHHAPETKEGLHFVVGASRTVPTAEGTANSFSDECPNYGDGTLERGAALGIPPLQLTVGRRGGGDGRRPVLESPTSDSMSPMMRHTPEPYTTLSTDSILVTVWHRVSVLISLLLLQSLSQFILERYESLLSDHVIVPLFLTMLVGAGGNAGNQSAVRSITGLVSGEFRPRDFWRVMRKEIIVGCINALILAGIGFSRVYYFYGHRNLIWSTIAITASLFCIVFTYVVMGASLPFLLGRYGYDREHAAPIIQVLMDITGVLVTCMLCDWIIPSSEHTTKGN